MPQIAQQDYLRLNLGTFGVDEIEDSTDIIKQQVNDLYNRGTLLDAILDDGIYCSRVIAYDVEEYELSEEKSACRVKNIYYIVEKNVIRCAFSYD